MVSAFTTILCICMYIHLNYLLKLYIYIYIYMCVCVYSRYFNLFGQVDFTVLSQAQVLANTLPCIRSCISICMEVYLD